MICAALITKAIDSSSSKFSSTVKACPSPVPVAGGARTWPRCTAAPTAQPNRLPRPSGACRRFAGTREAILRAARHKPARRRAPTPVAGRTGRRSVGSRGQTRPAPDRPPAPPSRPLPVDASRSACRCRAVVVILFNMNWFQTRLNST